MRMNNPDQYELSKQPKLSSLFPPANANRGHKKIENCTISGAYLVLLGLLFNSFNNLSVVYFINNR
jgi:hypothetical protein